MANGKFERGEMYWFKFGDAIGSETAAGRPGVIISSSKGNETSQALIIAMVTRQTKYLSVDVKTRVGGFDRWVLCNQIQTVDKSRAGNFIGALSKEEMQALDTALEEAFDLGYVDDSKSGEIEARDAEISTLKNKLAENENVASSMKMEIEMWKKCYDRAMDMLVQTKVNADYSLRTAKVEAPAVVETPKVEEPEQQEETERVEINTCSAEDLKRCGCSPVVVENIINSRPYLTLDELRVVNGVTSVAYGLLKHKLCCVPVKVEEPEQKTEESEVVVEPEVPAEPVKPVVLEKVNINTGTVREIAEHLGINTCYAGHISSHRNKNGKFVDLEELKLVKGLPKNFYDRYAHLCTIGVEEKPPAVEEPEQQTQGKVNVNTATAEEIFERTGLNIYTARNIVAYRKKNGPFRDIASLTLVNRFGPGCLKVYGDMLTVGEDEEPEEEPESGKVNINTASLRELMAVGFEKRAAALIVNERKKYGRFRSVDDLAEIPEISGKILRKLRDDLEV